MSLSAGSFSENLPLEIRLNTVGGVADNEKFHVDPFVVSGDGVGFSIGLPTADVALP